MDTQEKSSKTVNSTLAISKSSNSNTKSISVTTRNMSKKIKDSSQMTPLTEYDQKNLDSPSHASEDDGNKSPLSSLRSVFSYSFTTNVAPVMVTNAAIIEEQLVSLTRAIEKLTKHVQEQDSQIARLINKVDNVDTNHIMRKQVEAMMKQKHPQSNITLRRISLRRSFKFLLTGLRYILQGILPKSFEELATRAYDMELIMTISGVEGPPIQELHRTKEKHEKPQRKLTLKEMQARQYPFLDSDVSEIIDDLLEANLIDLPKMKQQYMTA
ncbi:UNVERIFIED_CONTAM: hypothetical protein Slati_2524200 [Sesamum latifolium]|uniref:Uncharacterized protein n=1 Tax=Sesamum latifolium TaxID=2727402 RepID=A0AAW2WF50_9LAMI